jgi:pimeloyl-ACP methyl ester carboxylesterase
MSSAESSTTQSTTGRLTVDDGVEIAYYDAGKDTAGLPPVVLSHGYVASAELNWVYTGVVPALLAAGRRVIGIDARGHGRSSKPHDPEFYGEGRMALDLGAVADVVATDSFDLVGYSMGAAVALVVAATDGRVRRLVIGGVGGSIVEIGGLETRLAPSGAVAEALLCDDPSTIANPAALAFRTLCDAVGSDRLAMAAIAQVRGQTRIELDRITSPTLLLAGKDDPLAQRPEALVNALKEARLQGLEGDHIGALADPRFVSAIVEFLAEP